MLSFRRVFHFKQSYLLTLFCMLLVFLTGCDSLKSALPPTPSPFPILARLPTVTPEPPTPTPGPTNTATPIPPTPTPTLIESQVIAGANLRTEPFIGDNVVTLLAQGSIVTITGKQGEWFQIIAEDGTTGWMAAEVLDITLDQTEIVPTVESNP